MSDFELWVEFMIPKVSNSGVFLHGIYEMQIWDSFGIVPRLDTDRTGALYHYEGGPINGLDGGTVPLVRAERDHGQWNSYHVWYQAPRFDASGKKIQNAMVLRALLNGQLIHENKERLGPDGGDAGDSRSDDQSSGGIAGRSRLRGVSQHLRAALALADSRAGRIANPLA